MAKEKRIWVICIGAGLLSLLIALLMISGIGSAPNIPAITMGYEDLIFKTDRIHRIDIYIDDWEGFLETCVDEKYSSCTVLINGEQLDNVGLRAKGNSSLNTVAEMGSSRYSFKLEFDHYDSEQTYHNLDKLNLNNLIQDNTMMKDYLSYRLMGMLGNPAPLCSYTTVYVNGSALGLYLAVEAIEESFLERNFGSDYGELYKPDADTDNDERHPPAPSESNPLQGQALRQALEQQHILTDRLGVTDWDAVTMDSLPQLLAQLPGVDVQALMQALAATESPSGDPHLRDVKLQYIDDAQDSYPNIFSNAKTNVTEEDKTRLIQALKQLSTGKKLKNTVDIEAVIRYFAIHNFVCNEDSYTGSTVHNYYLYEKDGKLTMLPWDYNLAFGGIPTGNASAVVNTSIYSPVSDGDISGRPMLAWILESKKYTWLYERYYTELLYMDMEALVEQTEKMIAPYVLRDPSKFCTYEEFETGVDTLKQFLELRAESVQLQLSGKPATVDVGALDLSKMGGVSGQALPPKN